MENQEKSYYQINLRSVFINFFQEKWLILFSSLILALTVFLYTTITTKPYYTASTEIYIMDNSFASSSMNYSDFQTAGFLTSDYEQLISNPTVIEPAIDKLDLKMSASALAKTIGVTAREDTRIIVISVSNTDPYLAADIANTVREVASEKIVSIMGIDAVNLVSEAKIPTEKKGMGSLNTTVFAFVLGLVISFCVILVLDIFDDSIKSPDEITEKLGLTSLGSIPYDPELKNQYSKKGEKK